MHVSYSAKRYYIDWQGDFAPEVNFITCQPSLCSGKDIKTLIYVITSPDHFKQREILRSTWARKSDYVSLTIFVIGLTSSNSTQKTIDQEMDRFGDMIQADFVDSYRNLTLKDIAAMKWIKDYCPNAEYVIKADDDIVVDIRHIAQIIKKQVYRDEEILPHMLCLSVSNSGIIRSPQSK